MKDKVFIEEFKDMVNKSVIVGLTYVNKDNSINHRVQFSGTITSCNNNGIVILKSDGEVFNLPPDPSAFNKAPAGEYTMKTTGEVVVNPYFMTTWTIELNDQD